MKKIRLALIAGHSGSKRGARNASLNINEWVVNKTLVGMIVPHLDKSYIEPVLFDRDEGSNGYTKLPAKINSFNPDYIIEFHDNSSTNESAKGNEVLYFHSSSRSKEFAENINNTLYRTLNVRDRGLKPISNKKENGWGTLKKTKAPCIIAEPAFFSNQEDTENLMIKFGDLAVNLANTLNEFLKKKL